MPQDDSVTAGPFRFGEKQEFRPTHRLEDVEPNHVPVSKGTSTVKTIANGLNALSGVGILSTPYALASAGWLSLILLFIISVSAFYTGILIKRSMEADSKIKNYLDIGERAFGNKGRIFIQILIYMEQFLIATGFLILEGDNLQNLFHNVHIEVAGVHVGGRQCFVLLAALIILPTVWLDDLSVLAYISATGVLATAITLGSVFWVGAFDGVGFHQKGKLFHWQGIPLAISLYAFCYGSHPVFPTLYSSMKKKHQFSNVLLICFVVSTFNNASMAIISYKMFGPKIQSSITLNLPTDKLSSKIAIYTTLVNPISKYALLVIPIVDATSIWFPWKLNKKAFNILVGTTLLICSVVVALTVPFFGYLMALVGAFLTLTASIIFPSLCYLKITDNLRRCGCEVVIIWGIIVLGVIVVISGTYSSIWQIVSHL